MTDFTDILTWLRAQLDEDEHDARRSYFHTDMCGRFLDPGDSCSCEFSDRVLREVAAKRQILDRHRPCENCGGEGFAHVAACHRCASKWPCAEVLSLSSIYPDRPGFDPRWCE